MIMRSGILHETEGTSDPKPEANFATDRHSVRNTVLKFWNMEQMAKIVADNPRLVTDPLQEEARFLRAVKSGGGASGGVGVTWVRPAETRCPLPAGFASETAGFLRSISGILRFAPPPLQLPPVPRALGPDSMASLAARSMTSSK